jgi:hypothetical protein
MAGNRKTAIGATLIVMALLVIAGVIVYIDYFDTEEEIPAETPETIEVDDRISPYTNQGLIVEVNRIRNRGLMDIILRSGSGWRKTPSFYWIVNVDGKECNSKGNVGRNNVYTKWDTLGEESHASFFIEEEQEKSEVTITIMEVVKTGLFKLRTEDVEKEKIRLTYDYRTARWTGDDHFKDRDGFGHYLGEDYEIWFNLYQIDYDNDGIPFWVETNVLDTDPTIDDSKRDPDNDGIPSNWEYRWGYDPLVWDDHEYLDPDIDGIENIEEYQMRKYFADPFQPDIYIETDGMEKKLINFKHVFRKEAQQMIIERFALHGINVYIDDGWPDGPVNGGGEMLPFYNYIDDVVGRQAQAFYEHNFADERKGIFRYVIIAHKHAGITFPCNNNAMDTILIGTGIKPTLRIKLAFTLRRNQVAMGKSVLHELGHSLGLMPYAFPGNDIMSPIGARYPNMDPDDYEKYLNQYYSIMNYNYIFMDYKLFDYSNGENGEPYDQNDWDHLYLPTFQINNVNYEEAVDETFEDFEVVIDYPGVILRGWDYNEELTNKYQEQLLSLSYVKNTDSKIRIYTKTEKNEDNERNLRVYGIPNVYPTFAMWSLVAEGYLDAEDKIQLYLQQELIEDVKELI